MAMCLPRLLPASILQQRLHDRFKRIRVQGGKDPTKGIMRWNAMASPETCQTIPR